jgi:hypothetical protein
MARIACFTAPVRKGKDRLCFSATRECRRSVETGVLALDRDAARHIAFDKPFQTATPKG